MKITKITLLLLGSTATVSADDAVFGVDVDADVDADVDVYQPPDAYSYAWRDERLMSKIGVGLVLGGGVSGFTDSGMRDAISSDAGGAWDLRLVLGSHTPLALELGYTGTAASLDTIRGDSDATLVGTTGEAALRWNMLPHNTINPYLFAGIGWQQYDVTGAEVTLADDSIDDTVDLVVAPVGVGMSYRTDSGLTVDLRGTVRIAEDEQLVADSSSELHSWQAGGAIGYEF